MLASVAAGILLATAAATLPAAAPTPFAEACSETSSPSCQSAREFLDRRQKGQCLVAFKAARLLYFFEDGKLVERSVDLKDYDPKAKVRVRTTVRFPVRMALSSRAVGHKLRLNDGRTPEGEYAICDSVARSQYTHFLSIDFPRQRDVDAAVRERRFGADALARVKRTQRKGACPDFWSALGGAIGIHGAPTHMAADLAAAEAKDPTLVSVTDSDWTLGCLAVENRHIRFLAREVKVGTPILIVP